MEPKETSKRAKVGESAQSPAEQTKKCEFSGTDYLSAEIALRNAEISKLRAQLIEHQLKINNLIKELDGVKKELEDIRHSFGYKLMRFFAPKIDRLFPEGTSRGEFRKIVTMSLRIIAEEGLRSYCRQTLEKIGRREFRVIDPLQTRTVRGLGALKPPLLRTTALYNLGDEELSRNLTKFLSTNHSTLEFTMCENPIVSLIIVTYNKARYTYQCLRSLLADQLPPYEVVIVDNASSDETSLLLSKMRNVSIIRNKTNEFFARGCNQGARASRAQYLLFLNPDAFVHPSCVNWLTRTIKSTPDIGAVGAKLVGRDGQLLEAGSIVWRDGSALGYGRFDDPWKPEYSYVREVDYCSAACLVVRRDIFEMLHGFDETFTPAYYEDTDLCMRLWDVGYRVVYQPMAVATHVEFAAGSFDNAANLMEKNRPIFMAKHKATLQNRLHSSERNILRARDRKSSPSILVIDDCVPKPEDGSGFPRMFHMLKSMASLGYRVTLLPLTDATATQPETHELNQMGVEVSWGNVGIRELLHDRQDAYDIILISRPHNALIAMNVARETNPQARLIYDAEALFYRREQMRRQLGLSPIFPRFESEEAELSIIRSSDYVMTVSEEEKQIIEEKLGYKGNVIVWGHPHAPSATQTSFEERSDLLFVGGFKSSPAHNDDAVIHFVNIMLPKVRKRIPDCRLIVAGSNPPESVMRLASDSVVVAGYVKDLRQLYENSRVFVAPIRFAAGTMWKVTEAMSYGLPCVLSAAASQGLKVKDGEEAVVAHDDDEFVEKTVQLYQDQTLWNRIRDRELEYIARNCDPIAVRKTLDDFLKRVSQSSTQEVARSYE